jgi:hypothetical protein
LWYTNPMINRTSDNNPNASKVLPALANQVMVEAQQSSRKRSTESLPRTTGAMNIESTQSNATERSSRKCSLASKSSKTGGINVKSTQSNATEYVKRNPRKRNVLWCEAISEICKDDPIKYNFQGIDRVRKLRMRNFKWCKVASKTHKSNSTPNEIQGINPSMASKSSKTGAMNVESTQRWSSRRRSTASQFSKTGTMNVESTHCNATEHVEREPRKRIVLWHVVILEVCKEDSIKGNC